MGQYDYYDDGDDVLTLSSLSEYIRAKARGESDDSEAIASVDTIFENLNRKDQIVDEIVKEMIDSLPKGAHIHHQTALQIGKLKATKNVAYYLLFSDIDAAYNMIQAQLEETYPNWKDDYYLTGVEAHLVVDDDDWKKYVYRYNLEHVRMSGCSSTIMPILYRFKKRNPNTSFSTEIQFFDILRMLSGEDTVVQTYVIHAAKTANVVE